MIPNLSKIKVAKNCVLRAVLGGAAGLAVLVVSLTQGAFAQSPPAPPAKEAPPAVVPLKPGYTVPDSERDPFYPESPKDSGAKGPTARELVDFLQRQGLVKGLMGKPEDTEKAGVLIGTKIYQTNDFIPVKFNNTVYSLVLVSVQFPATVQLKYKDEVVTMALRQNTTKGN